MLSGILWIYLILLCFLLHCAVLGFAFISLLFPTSRNGMAVNAYLGWFFALSAGCLLNILLLFFLGMLSILSPLYVALVGITLFISAYLKVMPGICLSRLRDIVSNPGRLAVLLLLALVLLIVPILAWHPPGLWDDTSFHLPMVRFYLQQEAIVLQEYLRFPLFPQNINLLILQGLMLGDSITAQAFATLPWFILTLGLMGVSRWIMGTPLVGLATALVVIHLRPLNEGLGFAYIDIGLSMFSLGGLLAIAIWKERQVQDGAWRWIFFAGLLAGGAVGSKLFGAVLVSFMGVYLVLMCRDIRAALWFSGGALLTGIWWYLRSYLISGDPVHPAGGEFFGYFIWNAQDLIAQSAEQSTHGVKPEIHNLWAALVAADIELWALVLPGVFMVRVPPAIRGLQWIVLGYFVFWFFVTQVPRYLAPIAPMATWLSFYSLYRMVTFFITPWREKISISAVRGMGVLLSLVLIIALALRYWHHRNVEWPSILENTVGYSLFAEANTLMPDHGNRLLQIGFENAAYFFDGITMGDWMGIARYRDLLDCREGSCKIPAADSLDKLLEKNGSRMIIVSKARYPAFKSDQYLSHFEVVLENDEGVLMVLKH